MTKTASPAQNQMWYLDSMDPSGQALLLSSAVRFRGPLNVEALQSAFHKLLCRHPTWTVRFKFEHRALTHIEHVPAKMPIQVVDCSHLPTQDCRAAIIKDTSTPIDLPSSPPVRATLFGQGPNEHVLSIVVHHIVSDGASMAIFWRDLAALYRSELEGSALKLPDVEGNMLSPAPKDIAFWSDYLGPAPKGPNLPTNAEDAASIVWPAACLDTYLDHSQVAGLTRAAAAQKASPFHSFLALLGQVFDRYDPQEQHVVMCPTSGRAPGPEQHQLGLFLKTVPLRLRHEKIESFMDAVALVRQDTIAALQHADCATDEILSHLAKVSTPDRHSLAAVAVVMNYQPRKTDKPFGPNIIITPEPTPPTVVTKPLTVYLTPSRTKWHITWEYAKGLISSQTIAAFSELFLEMACHAAQDPKQDLRAIELSSGQHQSGPPAPVTDVFLPQLLRRVQDDPDNIAVLTPKDEPVTISDLLSRAQTIAQALSFYNIGKGSVVGVSLQRSPDMIAALLGAFWVGAQIVPLDPSYPLEWRQTIAKRSRALVIIGKHAHWGAPCALPFIDPAVDISQTGAADLAPMHLDPEDPALILYTSGSTGTPKGVVLPHGAIANRVAWMTQAFPFAANETALQNVSLNFVDAIANIFDPLTAGCPLLLLPNGMAQDPEAFLNLCATQHITRLTLVPSLLEVLVRTAERHNRNMPSLRLIVSSGETLPASLASRARKVFPSADVLNLYGSTEVAGDVTWQRVAEAQITEDVILAGLPLPETVISIRDADERIMPPGSFGQVCVEGASLALGYHDDLARTAQAFRAYAPNKTIFFTGDYGRLDEYGRLHLVGRLDRMVKVNGKRVDLAGLEVILANHPQITKTAVIQRMLGDRPGRITAYIVTDTEAVLDLDNIRQSVAQRMPHLGSQLKFVRRDALPLLRNGKIDRRALDRETPQNTHNTSPTPKTVSPVEQKVCEAWEKTLGLTARPDLHSGFFDLGGHSLLLFELQHNLEQSLNTSISLPDLLIHPTISSFSAQINRPALTGTMQLPTSSQRAPSKTRRTLRQNARLKQVQR